MNRHPFHLKQTLTLSILACLAVFQVDTYAADFVLKETSVDKLICNKVEGEQECHVENSGRYTLDIKVSKQDFEDSNVRFQEFNECSPIAINIGGLDFASRFCDADKWPIYPWQDLNAKWSEAESRCKQFGVDEECLREHAITYRTIVAKILKTGGMLLKINGIYRVNEYDAETLGQPVLKNDCLDVDESSTLLTLTIGNYELPSISGQVACNTQTSTKYDGQFELKKMTISAKKVEE